MQVTLLREYTGEETWVVKILEPGLTPEKLAEMSGGLHYALRQDHSGGEIYNDDGRLVAKIVEIGDLSVDDSFSIEDVEQESTELRSGNAEEANRG